MVKLITDGVHCMPGWHAHSVRHSPTTWQAPACAHISAEHYLRQQLLAGCPVAVPPWPGSLPGAMFGQGPTLVMACGHNPWVDRSGPLLCETRTYSCLSPHAVLLRLRGHALPVPNGFTQPAWLSLRGCPLHLQHDRVIRLLARSHHSSTHHHHFNKLGCCCQLHGATC